VGGGGRTDDGRPEVIRLLAALVPDADRGRFRTFVALVVVGTVVRAASCVVLVPIVRELFGDQPSDAWPWVGALTALTVAGWVVDLRASRTGFAVGAGLMESLLVRLADRLREVPLGWLTPERTTAAQRTLTSVGPEVFSGMSNMITPVTVATLLPYAIGVLLLAVSWPIGLAALVCAPLLQAARAGSDRLQRGADARFTEAAEDVDQRVVEFARTQPVLRGAGRAGAEGSALDDALVRQRGATLGLLGWSIPGRVLFSIASQATLLVLALTTVGRWRAGDLGVPEAIAVFVVIVRYLEPFTELADLAPAVETLRATLRRTIDLVEAPPLPRPERPEPLPAGPVSVELADVRFEAGGRAILDGVSFVAPAGATTAIVGPSGAGKTTALSLIARFHDVDGGSVRIGGRDVRDVDPDALLDQLGIVFQDVYLFDGTIRDNVRQGRPGATDAEVDAAAVRARVDEIVARLPDGWDTRVGEGGAALSGGERQRVSLARALLKDAPVLLLDEATSAIDSENEAAVLAALTDGSDAPAGADGAGRTVVIVAHRERTIAHADHVVFVEDGRVIEAGARDELLALGGRFASYWDDRRAAARWTL